MLHFDAMLGSQSSLFHSPPRALVCSGVLIGLMLIGLTAGCGGGATQVPTVTRIAEDVILPPAEVAAPVPSVQAQPTQNTSQDNSGAPAGMTTPSE